MIAADLGRALLLAIVPALALLHRLSMTHLIAIAACTGVLSVLFDVAYQSYLPVLAAPDDLFEGNRLLALSESTAEVLGPSLTGVLVQLVTAPVAIVLDAASFVVSALSLTIIKVEEPTPEPVSGIPIRTEILEGISVVLAHPTLRLLFFRSIAAYLSMGPFLSFYMLYAIRNLHIQPAALGMLIALGGVGSLAGAFLAPRVSTRFSLSTLFLSGVVMAVAQFLIPLASLSASFSITCLAIQQLVGDCAWTIYLVNETTLRQTVVPAQFLGRVNAAAQLASRGMLPVGALAAGFLGTSLGIVPILWLGAAGVLLSSLFLVPLLAQTERRAGV
jgi:predicted MFS family arabinose efflux permease